MACAVIPSRPIIVSAASRAFTTAASTASTVAWNSGEMALSRIIRASIVRRGSVAVPVAPSPRLPVAKAMNRSPEPFDAIEPIRASPRPARWASRSHWWGNSGASVARTTMIEPPSGPMRAAIRGAASEVATRASSWSQGLGTSLTGIASPTGTPSTRSSSREP